MRSPRVASIPLALARVALLGAGLAGCPDPEPAPRVDADAEDGDGDVAAEVIHGLPLHDDLARPATPTLDPADFQTSAKCGRCHATHRAEWATSMHAYATVDPVFRALVGVRQADYAGAQDQFCMQCHTAVGTRGGEVTPGFAFGDLSAVAAEGVTCVSCHAAQRMERLFDSGHVLDPKAIRGPAGSVVHGGAASPLFASSELCAGCHEVVELSGLPLERPYAEWLESPSGAAGEQCQDCHMPTYRGSLGADLPERDLHRHTWVGVDVPLAPGFAAEAEVAALRDAIAAVMATACTLTVEAAPEAEAGQQLDLVVTVRNAIRGHSLPTGSTFIRQMWLEVVAKDATDRVLYETGTFDSAGDLRNHWSGVDPYGDPDLVVFGSAFIDARGAPELFPWRAAEHTTTAIPPGYARTSTLFVPVPADAVGPVSVSVRVRFRTHPPFLMRALGLASLVDKVQTYDLASASLSVPVVGAGGR